MQRAERARERADEHGHVHHDPGDLRVGHVADAPMALVLEQRLRRVEEEPHQVTGGFEVPLVTEGLEAVEQGLTDERA